MEIMQLHKQIETLNQRLIRHKREIKRLKQQTRRSTKKQNEVETSLKEYTSVKLLSNDQVKVIDPAIQAIMNRLFLTIASEPQPRIYPTELRKFILKMHHFSPKAYFYLRSKLNFCLPHKRTISKWYEHLKGQLNEIPSLPAVDSASPLNAKAVSLDQTPVTINNMNDQSTVEQYDDEMELNEAVKDMIIEIDITQMESIEMIGKFNFTKS